MPHYKVEPRFNEVPRDWGNWFVISRVHYIEVLFHTLHYYWAEKYRSLYRGLCYNYRGSLNQGCTVQVVEVQNTPTASPTTSFFAGSPIIALAPCQTLQPTALLYKRAVGCNVWHGARAMIGEPAKNEVVGEAVGVFCTSTTCTVQPWFNEPL